MASTTLMTFLLHTNPHVQSVKLLGSWDNFSKPYPMEKDKRVGAGHWRGCHTFTNIICDGTPSNTAASRSGGLKMGGTYWYYYLLDDDVEFYNHAEQVTSHCPLLPGQPVNVLQVPVILPDAQPSHARDGSLGSEKAVHRTMNPDDKYMNPRRPPKPTLPRLRTSPPLLQQPTPAWSFNASPLGLISNRGTSQPSSATPKATLQSGHRVLGIKAARSVSPPRSRGLRAAFRHWNASSPDLSSSNQDDNIPKTIPAYDSITIPPTSLKAELNLSQNNQNGRIQQESFASTPQCMPSQHSVHHEPSLLSIQDRRALKPKHTEITTPKAPLTIQASPETISAGSRGTVGSSSQTVRNPISPEESTLLATALPASLEDATTPTPFVFAEKRLPTLPNTPSSVMEEALRDLESRGKELDAENFGSHFSDFSATEGSTASSSCERSHFSEWSTDTEMVSPESMTSSLTLNNEAQALPDGTEFTDHWKINFPAKIHQPGTPELTDNSRLSPATVSDDSPRPDLPLPRLTISLSPSDIDFSGLCLGDADEVERNPKRHAALFGGVECLGLGLLRTPEASATCFPANVKDDTESARDARSPRSNVGHDRFSTSSIPGQSAAMQEMMDELSYLKNMIRSGADEEH
ncbi:hypothetical protein BDV25DRAFT_156340 [Aspergillus avenaceus]|uniref:Uncharacterized protein n=1 Tax=Aspergillus avenaceus TaxID=36643 RepID=A0A5N6TSU2_ASPAV|nr:hypothetical protein BDV25DRAFT_156340 [Aspergillus avenaceus]